MDFKQYSDEFMELKATPHNSAAELEQKRMCLKNHLVPYFGKYELEAIKARHLDGYIALKKKAGLSHKTINNHLTILRRMLGVAQEWELLAKVPKIEKLRGAPAAPRFFSSDEMDALLAAAESPWREMILVAAHTGLRVGELQALHWENVDLRARQINVIISMCRITHEPKAPKNDRARVVPMTVAAVQTLKGILRLGDWVFGKPPTGEPYSYMGCQKAFGRIALEAGIVKGPVEGSRHIKMDGLGWHTLRHTFASHLAMSGVSLYQIKELLGHATLEMTQVYAHLCPKEASSAVDVLDKRILLKT